MSSGLFWYINHFRAYLEDPIGFPLIRGPSLPLSRLSRVISANLQLQTIWGFFLLLDMPLSLATEHEGSFQLLPSSADRNFSTRVMVSNFPPFTPIGCTAYDYAALPHRSLLGLCADHGLVYIGSEAASTHFYSSVMDTLASANLFCNMLPPPDMYLALFRATLASIPHNPHLFTIDYVQQALRSSLSQSLHQPPTETVFRDLVSHILSHRISDGLSPYTHPTDEHHLILNPYRLYVFPPTPSTSSRILTLGPCTVQIQPVLGGQIGLITSPLNPTTPLEGTPGILLSLLAIVNNLKDRPLSASQLHTLFSLSREGSRVALTTFGSLLSSTPPASLAHTSQDQKRLVAALSSPPYLYRTSNSLIEDLLHFITTFDALPSLFPHATMPVPHVVLVAYSSDPDTRPPEVLTLMYFLPGSTSPRIFHFPLSLDLGLEDSPLALTTGYVHTIILSLSDSLGLTSRYWGTAFHAPAQPSTPSAGPPLPPSPPPSTAPVEQRDEHPPPRPPTQSPPPPIHYMVTDLLAPYSGLYLAGIPRRYSLTQTLDNIWHPFVALGLHEFIPGASDLERREHILGLLRPPVAHAPWASTYSLLIGFSSHLVMENIAAPFSTPLSFSGRRDPGGVMNPTFTITLLSAADFDLISPSNELFTLRGPYIASLLDGLDIISIQVVTAHFSSLFPSTPFVCVRDFLSHRLTRGRKASPHSAWEASVILYAPAGHHRDVMNTLRSMALPFPGPPPCLYRLVATTGTQVTSLMQAKEPLMLLISPHIRAEITLASHNPELRVLPHPDHGRQSAPYLYASIGDSHPAEIIAALERLIATGTLTEPWHYFFMDHRRRLFHGVWLLPTLPTHHSHCLYIATESTPDSLRLPLGDLPTLVLTPIPRHPLLSPSNLDHTPLGVLTRAHESASSPSSTSPSYDHLSDPYVSTWADILFHRPFDATLGSERRSFPSPHSSLTLSATPPSLRDNPHSPTPSHRMTASQPLAQTPPSWQLQPTPPSPVPWPPSSTLSTPGPGAIIRASTGPPPSDDRLDLLLEQMSALTQLMGIIASRLPPPPPSRDK